MQATIRIPVRGFSTEAILCAKTMLEVCDSSNKTWEEWAYRNLRSLGVEIEGDELVISNYFPPTDDMRMLGTRFRPMSEAFWIVIHATVDAALAAYTCSDPTPAHVQDDPPAGGATHCPKCGSDNIMGESYDQVGSRIEQGVTCGDCDASWVDFYKHDDVQILESQVQERVGGCTVHGTIGRTNEYRVTLGGMDSVERLADRNGHYVIAQDPHTAACIVREGQLPCKVVTVQAWGPGTGEHGERLCAVLFDD